MKNNSEYHFFSMLSRMKYITRWGLMNNTRSENISEHSLQTAYFAHILTIIANKRYGEKLNPERAALLAMYHDCSEILTGDMPTPVKYFDPQIIKAYKNVERSSCEKMLSMLPEDLKDELTPVLLFEGEEDEKLKKYIKAADKLSALVKCIEEMRMGNDEFKKAKEATEEFLTKMEIPAVDDFMKEFLPSFYLTLDEQE